MNNTNNISDMHSFKNGGGGGGEKFQNSICGNLALQILLSSPLGPLSTGLLERCCGSHSVTFRTFLHAHLTPKCHVWDANFAKLMKATLSV